MICNMETLSMLEIRNILDKELSELVKISFNQKKICVNQFKDSSIFEGPLISQLKQLSLVIEIMRSRMNEKYTQCQQDYGLMIKEIN